MKLFAAAAVTLLTAGAGLMGTHPVPVPPPRPAQCSQVVISWRNPGTGHEVDMPVTMCGGMRPGSWQCGTSGSLGPGATLDCSHDKTDR